METHQLVTVLLVFCSLRPIGGYEIPPGERTFPRDVRASHPTAADSPNGCFVPPLPVALPEGSLDDVISMLEKNISSAWSASASILRGSLSVNLIYDQDIVWSKGFGEKNYSDPSAGKPDGDTAYRIASISKVFTTLQALQLRDEGSWHLDQEVATCIPGFEVLNPFATSRSITLRQLASHMAGLSREAPCVGTYNTGCNATEAEILERIKGIPLVRPPGLKPSYSNLGFALLGVAEMHHTGRPWVDLVKIISSDLGMKNTHADIPARTAPNIAEGYMADGSLAKWVDIGFEAPAGQMFSSAYDLAQLIKLIFRTNVSFSPSTGQVLDGESLREWMQPVYMAPDLTGYGLAWELFQAGPYNFRSKDGAIIGYRSFILFVPEIKVGAVVLLANENSQLLNQVVRYLVDAMFGVTNIMAQHQAVPALPPSPVEYVGTYTHNSDVPDLRASANVSFQTTPDGLQLLSLAGVGRGGVMLWLKDDLFQLTDRYTPHYCSSETSGDDNIYVRFTRDPHNTVVAMTTPGFLYGYVLIKTPASRQN